MINPKGMDLEYFVNNYKDDPNFGRSIALYLIASANLAPEFQKRNTFRGGVAGSRETQNIDRSVTPSGAESRASSLYSRCAMYLANNIQGMVLVAALVLPPSVVNAPTGPTITRILEKRRPGDARPDFALRGKTMAVALEQVYHNALDEMPKVSRARTSRQEWFKTSEPTFRSAKLALQSVGQGVYYDLSNVGNVPPSKLQSIGRKLSGGQVLDTTTHGFRESPRLKELRRAILAGEEVTDEDGTIRLDPQDVQEIRDNTERGQMILDLITQRRRTTTQTQTAQVDPAAPVQVRMTRGQIARLRQAANSQEEKRRRRVARALAQLTT
jgi:hypothetical protein